MVVTVVVRTARPRNRTQSDEAAAGRFFTTRNFICCCSNPSQLPATAADHKTAHWPPVPTRSSAEENFALFRTREKKRNQIAISLLLPASTGEKWSPLERKKKKLDGLSPGGGGRTFCRGHDRELTRRLDLGHGLNPAKMGHFSRNREQKSRRICLRARRDGERTERTKCEEKFDVSSLFLVDSLRLGRQGRTQG